MDNELTFPYTYESGITIIRQSAHGAFLISDGMNVAWIQRRWLREDGTLTHNGMSALLNSDETVEDQMNKQKAWEEKKAAEKKAWEEKKAEGAKRVTYIIEKGILKSGGPYSYKYACGRGYDMYRRVCTHYVYLPKNQVEVERKNNKVYVTLPKWLAEKHPMIFKEVM